LEHIFVEQQAISFFRQPISFEDPQSGLSDSGLVAQYLVQLEAIFLSRNPGLILERADFV
jgi:hypothetical protein